MAPRKTKEGQVVEQTIMQQLYEKFPPEKLKERKGRGGQNWKYIDSADIVDRLNKVFGLNWSVYEESSEIINGFLCKRVLLSIYTALADGSVIKSERFGWGAHPLADSRGNAYDMGDVHKSATSKAITKATSLFGVGLYLWGVDSDYEGNNPDGVVEAAVAAYQPPQTAPPQNQTPNVPPWEGQNQFNQQDNRGIPPQNVNVVNAGPHNNIPVNAQVMPPPQQQNNQGNPPQLFNPGPPPQNVNQQAYIPPTPQPQMGNPNMGQGVVQNQVSFQGDPNTQGTGPIVPFQLNAIIGISNSLGLPVNVMIAQALKLNTPNLPVENLTYDQGVIVMDYYNQITGNSNPFNMG